MNVLLHGQSPRKSTLLTSGKFGRWRDYDLQKSFAGWSLLEFLHSALIVRGSNAD